VDLIKDRKFVRHLGDFHFLKKDSAPWSMLLLFTVKET
jgi:hypothetical protein